MVQHGFSIPRFPELLRAEGPKELYVLEASRKARIKNEDAIFCGIVLQAANEQLEVIGSQDDDGLLLKRRRSLPDPLDHGEPLVCRFGRTPGCEEQKQARHCDRHDDREYQEWAPAPHGQSME